MKCVSVIAERRFVHTMGPAVITTRERHPKPKAGIRVDANVRQLDMANGTTVRVSEKFFQPGMSAQHAVWIGRFLHILRASVVYDNVRGDFELAPETDPNDDTAIVYLDVSAGNSDRVIYEARPFAVASCGTVSSYPWAVSEDVLLALLAPGETITAVRARRRWLFWGAFQTKEIISYALNGATIDSHMFA